MDRHRNSRQRLSGHSVTIQITTTEGVTELLDRLVETGFYGTSRAAAAERLLSEGIRMALKEGVIGRRQKAMDL